MQGAKKDIGFDGFNIWARSIQEQISEANKSLNRILESNFTKQDMEIFKQDVCLPSRRNQDIISIKVNKLSLLKAKIVGIVITINILLGILLFFKDPIIKVIFK